MELITLYYLLYNQINARSLIGQSAVYCASKLMRASSELLYKSNRPQLAYYHECRSLIGYATQCAFVTNDGRFLAFSKCLSRGLTLSFGLVDLY